MKILACQGAGVTVAGIYPMVFPPIGYKGQLYWLSESAVCLGKDAYSSLLAASKEGEVELPSHVEIRMCTEQAVHLGPNLTQPSPSKLKWMPSLAIDRKEEMLLVTHKDVKKEIIPQSGWELDIPIGDIDYKEEVKRKKVEPEDEEPEEVIFEEIPKDKDKATKNKEDEDRKKTVYVSCKKIVIKNDLQTHFKKFGDVEDIIFTTSDETTASVRFTSSVIAQSLIGKEQMLHGSIPLRLRGGSGRQERVPPLQQRLSVCPFR